MPLLTAGVNTCMYVRTARGPAGQQLSLSETHTVPIRLVETPESGSETLLLQILAADYF
jgi:hypothetical protein